MIIIHGDQISVVDLEKDRQFFTPETGWIIKNERIEDYLFEMLEDPVQEFNFSSYSQLYQIITSDSIKQPLPDSVKQFHPSLNGVSVTIEMTGNYIDDFLAAARQVTGLSFDSKGCIDGYVWHHVEGIKYVSGTPTCKMQLLSRACHSKPHSGAVSQYRNAHGGYGK